MEADGGLGGGIGDMNERKPPKPASWRPVPSRSTIGSRPTALRWRPDSIRIPTRNLPQSDLRAKFGPYLVRTGRFPAHLYQTLTTK